MSIDLHIHSTFSDGSMTPSELVRLARQKGLPAIAITDHDTVAGIAEAVATGKEYGVEVVTGLELSVRWQDFHLHLLAYGFDPTSVVLDQALCQLQEGRRARNAAILKTLTDLGFRISAEELAKVAGPGQCGRPHIAAILRQIGAVASHEEAFRLYLGRNGLAYRSRPLLQLAEAIVVIHQAGGLAVLAHPLQACPEPSLLAAQLPHWCQLGLDGLEVYYPTHSRRQRREMLALAERHSLLATGGSDYHGAIRPQTTLAGGKNNAVPNEVLALLKVRLDQRL